jgi:hypothetical protein
MEVAMKKAQISAVAAILIFGPTIPAVADWNPLGEIQESPNYYTNVQLGGFSGPVERIRIRSHGRSDCEMVGVKYANGVKQEVFSGTLFDRQDQTINFPGAPKISGVALECRAADGDGSRITVAADTEHGVVFFQPSDFGYQTREFGQFSRSSDLTPLASRDFGFLNQRSLMLNDSEPRSTREIALQPVGANARCRNVEATFDDGITTSIVPNDGDELLNGRIYRFRVARQDHDLDSINLTCQAENGDHVKINVYAVV